MAFLLLLPNSYRGGNVLAGGFTWQRWWGYVSNRFNFVPLVLLWAQVQSVFAGQNVARNLIYLVGNFIGFAPLGFFLPALFARQRKFFNFFATVLVGITALELTQVLTMQGTFDVDDIILNTLGACIGFLLLRIPVAKICGLQPTEKQNNKAND